MKVLGCRIDEDGAITIEWYHEHEQGLNGGTMHQSIITPNAFEAYEHVGYYAKELMGDLEELVAWYEKYRTGAYED